MKLLCLLIGVLACSEGVLGWGWGGDHPQLGAPRSGRAGSSFDKLANSNELYSADILGHAGERRVSFTFSRSLGGSEELGEWFNDAC